MKLKLLSLILIISVNIKAQIPTNGLVGSWLFTGNVLDSSGYNNDGTVFGASLTNDRSGTANNAYSFNGTNSYISIPVDSFLLDTYTYSIWSQIYSIPNSGTYPLAMSIGSGANGGDQNINVLNLGGSNLGWSGGGYNQGSNPSTSSVAIGSLPITNTWHHLVLTRDNNFVKFYVDCQLIDSSSTGGQPALYGSGLKYFYIGARSGLLNANYYFDGAIDDIYIYNRVLASNEMAELCNAGSVGINKLYSDLKIKIYPNPTSNQLLIDTELDIREIEIIDITGKIIMTTKENTTTINVVNLTTGIYFIKLITDEKTITKKFVKQ